ncbi:MAG: hypothetical protein KDC45_15495, partial [Bacteroidetes bacterium]|nr:hypothetical protein [Bacteroidota bacterium]
MKSLFVGVFFCAGSLLAQHASPYLPIDHWAYSYIEMLQIRGHLPELYYSVRPYRRSDITSALARIDENTLSNTERHWIHLLNEELSSHSNNQADNNVILRANGSTGAALQNKTYDGDIAFEPEITLSSPYFAGSLRGRIDNDLIDDPTYTGRRSNLVGARVEDGYGLLQWGAGSFYIGRVANIWSPFPDRSLIVSSNPYTYDQIGFAFQTRYFALRAFHAQLSDQNGIHRYLAAHRLDVRLPHNIQLGFTESVLYGGPNQQTDLSYLNPFTVFLSIQLNDKKEANELLAFDAYVPFGRFAFKSQILVDDFILDGANDPAPNRKTSNDRLGFIFGLQGADLLMPGSVTELRYERVGSYTYNVKTTRPWQSYTQNSRGIGAGANDYDAWLLQHRYFPLPAFVFSADISFGRSGERSLASNTFVDSTFVKLPFPSGQVQKRISFGIGVSYIHSSTWNSRLTASIDH